MQEYFAGCFGLLVLYEEIINKIIYIHYIRSNTFVNTNQYPEFPEKIPVAEEHFLGFAGEATPQRAIRAIYGSVAAEKAPHLHADPCQTRVVAVEVAQVHVVSQLPLQNLDVHFSICETLGSTMHHSCHRHLFWGNF